MNEDLKGEKRALIVDVPRDIASLRTEGLHVLADVCEILIAASGVDDQVDVVISHLGDDRIIDGASPLVREHGERPSARSQPLNVGDDKLLQEADGILPLEAEPAHVGDVEEAAVGAAVEGGIHNRVLVLDRHAPSGEGDHLAAILHVKIVQHRPLQLRRRLRLRREAPPPTPRPPQPARQRLPQLPQPSPHPPISG